VQFEQFLLSMGLLPREIVPGKWVRCPTVTHPRSSNGSYKLADDCQVGWAMDFAVQSEPLMWREESKEMPRIDRSAIARRQRQEGLDRQRASREAAEYYMTCEPIRGEHEYLTKKNLTMTGCYGLKRDRAGALIVPMMIGKKLSSLQKICLDGSKRFWPGAVTRGATYTIERAGAPLTILCEGLATGLSLYAAIPAARVVVAFSAGNLIPACDAVPRGMAVVAADNDYQTAERIGVNPGVRAANQAAEAMGCGVAIPYCKGTDWNDLYNERTEELREIELTKRRPKTFADIAREVDAEMRSAVMRHARLRGRAVL